MGLRSCRRSTGKVAVLAGRKSAASGLRGHRGRGQCRDAARPMYHHLRRTIIIREIYALPSCTPSASLPYTTCNSITVSERVDLISLTTQACRPFNLTFLTPPTPHTTAAATAPSAPPRTPRSSSTQPCRLARASPEHRPAARTACLKASGPPPIMAALTRTLYLHATAPPGTAAGTAAHCAPSCRSRHAPAATSRGTTSSHHSAPTHFRLRRRSYNL